MQADKRVVSPFIVQDMGHGYRGKYLFSTSRFNVALTMENVWRVLIHGIRCKDYTVYRRVTRVRGKKKYLPSPRKGLLFVCPSNASESSEPVTGARQVRQPCVWWSGATSRPVCAPGRFYVTVVGNSASEPDCISGIITSSLQE